MRHYHRRVAIDVSVVIPFFNPGADIDDCLASMLAQTLPRERFEVVLADDGSTDGSSARVDGWVARYPDLLRVFHNPASGGPARPRNVGIEQSRGRYILFVDSDDTLPPNALAHQLDVADESDADIVVGKMSSGGPRGAHHPLFRQTVTRRTLDDLPRLTKNLTVHKMFRREFLLDHQLRFPDGPNNIEDQHLAMRAYTHAQSVAVVSDLVCYFYRQRRAGGDHFGDARVAPASYAAEVSHLLDIVDTEIPSDPTRAYAYDRHYCNEILGRLRGNNMLAYDEDYRRQLTATLRELAATRFPEEVRANLAAFQRTQSRLLLDNDADGLADYAERLKTIRLTATAGTPRWRDGVLLIEVDGRLLIDGQPFALEPVGAGWALPAALAPGVDVSDRLLGAGDAADLDIDLAVISRVDSSLWSTTEGLALNIDNHGVPRFHGEVAIDPAKVAGGGGLGAGIWDLRLRVLFGGMSSLSRLHPANEYVAPIGSWLTPGAQSVQSVTPFWDGRSPRLTLDVDEWSSPLHDRIEIPAERPARLDDSRHVVIPAALLQGAAATVPGSQLILVPTPDDAALAMVHCDAELHLTPNGSSLSATIPELSTAPGRWAVWLRIGPVGGAPPRLLSLLAEPREEGR
jgi:glycosyltransferase involved in cell wall biosynthesis